MNVKLGMCAVLAGISASFVAQADQAIEIHGRLGASFGQYANEFKISGVDLNNVPVSQRAKREELVYGLLGGVIAIMDGYYANTEFEIQQIDDDDCPPNSACDDFKSTDLTLTLGKQFSNGWGPFIGYRHVRQGDGVFDSDIQRENGYFLGLSYSGLQISDSVVTSFGAA